MGREDQQKSKRKPLPPTLSRGTLSQGGHQTPGTTGLKPPAAPPSPADFGAQVVAFARSKLKRKVGDGECFALADKALRAAKAATAEDFCKIGADTDYIWSSKTVQPAAAQPGDILQFRDFTVGQRTDRPDGSWQERSESRPHHTAVVASVRTEGSIVFLTILEQNVTIGGTKGQAKQSVRENEIPAGSGVLKRGTDTVKYTVEGTLWIYRPETKSP